MYAPCRHIFGKQDLTTPLNNIGKCATCTQELTDVRMHQVALKGSKFVFVLFLICCIMLTLVYNDFNFLKCNAVPTQPTEIVISEEEVPGSLMFIRQLRMDIMTLAYKLTNKVSDFLEIHKATKLAHHTENVYQTTSTSTPSASTLNVTPTRKSFTTTKQHKDKGKEKYKPCRKQELLTYVTKNDNIATLHIDHELVPSYSSKGVTCCYSNVTRKHNTSNPDGSISISSCEPFENYTTLHHDPVIVKCTDHSSHTQVYENAHAPITITEDVQKKIDNFDNNTKPLSILFVGIDSISRLNLIRAMPQTYKFVRDNDWVPLVGYNKMDDNTFPNLMAILTGFNSSLSYKICDPFTVGKLDAWYITAYGEDETTLNTFNYRKKGFDTPPADYYFRPYVIATEKLSTVTKDSMTYCTGPETAGERIMNLAKDFAFTFKGYPTFGFFWMNSFSHNKLNTPTGMDGKVKSFLEGLTNEAGITGHWCTCLGFAPVSLEKSLEKAVVSFVLNEVHEILKKGKGTRPCAKFKLDRVLKLSLSQKLPYQNESHLLVQLQTKPKAVFETTLSFIGDIHGQNFTTSGSISRLDSYNDHRFLVYSSKCKIVDLHPFNPEASQFYSSHHHIKCTDEELLTYVTKNDNVARLHINKSVLSLYGHRNVRCCYSNVSRQSESRSPDNLIRVIIYENPVLVKCSNNEGFTYKNAHVAVTITKAVKDKIGKSQKKKPISLLMIAIDSISRLNLVRAMPSTYEYVESHGWIPLLGYNKMGDNTFPNLMAILTGFDSDTSYQVCNPEILGKLDACPMIWYNYSKHGYVTAYAEDDPVISTFNYAKRGFKYPPTDYYFRPYMRAADTLGSVTVDSVSYCTGPETSGERIMNLARDFSVTFKGYPSLGLFWMNTFSHNDINSPTRMDGKVKDFLESLAEEGVTNSSIIVFFSDHGIRYGNIRLYNTGWLEERLPFIYFSFPSWFKSDYPRLFENFKKNADRLTSPYDFYMMLQHILSLEDETFEPKPSSGCPSCRSLFDEIPFNRSCEEAGISVHFCTCYGYSDIKLPENIARSAAQVVIDGIHNRVKTEPSCLRYKLHKVRRIAISQTKCIYWFCSRRYPKLCLKQLWL
nr:unnamed protein product [Callosobruchus analis]